MRRSRPARLLADAGWVAVGLVTTVALVALWVFVIWGGVAEPYDPWNERARPYLD